MKKIVYFLILLLSVFVLCDFFYNKSNNIKYLIIEKHNNIEIREYKKIALAQAIEIGSRKNTIKNGYKKILTHIKDNNRKAYIQMLFPVIQKKIGRHDKWAIYVPLSVNSSQDIGVYFNDEIKPMYIQNKTFAVVRFTCFASDRNIAKNLYKLNKFIKKMNFVSSGKPLLAFYSMSCSLPFFQRNEIMLEVEKK